MNPGSRSVAERAARGVSHIGVVSHLENFGSEEGSELFSVGLCLASNSSFWQAKSTKVILAVLECACMKPR